MKSSKEKNFFITFEGIEGSGKTTQSALLYEYFIQKKIEAILTREVGGTELAQNIRDLFLKYDMNPKAELLLAMAARVDHVEKKIAPALKNGIVICDRFIDSTAAYQGSSHDIGFDMVYELHERFFNLMPDITFFINVNIEEALKRVASRGNANRFDQKEFAFHKQTAENFQKLKAKFPQRIIEIDGSLAPDLVHKQIIDALLEPN